MLAGLGMYEWPQLEDAYHSFWNLIRDDLRKRGIDAPEALTRNAANLAFWSDPNLVLSQTCSCPYRTWLHDKVHLVATPDYGVPGCPPGYYCSYFIARKDDRRKTEGDFRNARFAFNEMGSQSGFVAAQDHARMCGFEFREQIETGGHVKSALAVASGQADIASVDAVTWRFAQNHEEFTEGLRILARTRPTPGLPYICARGVDGDIVFSAVSDALERLADNHRRALLIKNLVRFGPEVYLTSNSCASRGPDAPRAQTSDPPSVV